MVDKMVGFIDVKKNADDWAMEVSAIAEALIKEGFEIHLERDDSTSMKQYQETYYEREKGPISLSDSSSWVRLVTGRVVVPVQGNISSFVEFRKGIDGEVKRLAIANGKIPTTFDIEGATREFGGLKPVITATTDAYKFRFEKPREDGKLSKLSLSYKVQKVKGKEHVGFITSLAVTDKSDDTNRTQKDEEVTINSDFVIARKIVKRYMNENNKSVLVGNPYMDIEYGIRELSKKEIKAFMGTDE